MYNELYFYYTGSVFLRLLIWVLYVTKFTYLPENVLSLAFKEIGLYEKGGIAPPSILIA